MNSNLAVIIGREYKERVNKKSFIITTLLMPLLMVAMMAGPALIMHFNQPETRTVAVVDNSGFAFAELKKLSEDHSYLKFEQSKEPVDKLKQEDKYFGVLVIGSDLLENNSDVSLYARDAAGIEMESQINDALARAIRDRRLQSYNISGLDKILDEVDASVSLRSVRLGEEEQENMSSMVSYALGFIMTFCLYMFLLMYGQMVMTSIIEEKNNRVLELVVSSVRPMQLMVGKIVGVGLTAVTQIVIWCVLICFFASLVMPMILPPEVAAQVSSINAGQAAAGISPDDADMVKAIAMFTSVGFIVKIFIYMLLYLVGGFVMFASMFAAIGSAVDNVQDASQLSTFAVLPIVFGLILGISSSQDPNGALAVWVSMIPFTSPIAMPFRIPFGIPDWQIWVSLAILYASSALMAWFAGKIYRVGIFMYGKKPNVKDLIRWARYK